MKKGNGKLLLVYILLGVIAAALLVTLVILPPAVMQDKAEQRKDTQRPEETAIEPSESLPEEKPGKDTVKKPMVKGHLIFVIDDVGYNLKQLQPFLDLPFKITFAILPGLAYTEEAAAMIHNAGKEYILHQPMDAVNGSDTGPGVIHKGMSIDEVRNRVTENLVPLPLAAGINNHMGSAGTADKDLMVSLFTVLKGKGMFFLDSRTTSNSVGAEVAVQIGLPFAERSVFLDNNKEKKAIEESIEKGVDISEKKGHAVMIGHIWSAELAEVLLEMYPTLLEDNYTLNNLTELFMGYKDDEDTWY